MLLVDRPGLGQASVALGEPGVSLRDADAPALDLLTSVLNNFGGRLFNQIRSREVLAEHDRRPLSASAMHVAGVCIRTGQPLHTIESLTFRPDAPR